MHTGGSNNGAHDSGIKLMANMGVRISAGKRRYGNGAQNVGDKTELRNGGTGAEVNKSRGGNWATHRCRCTKEVV